MGKICGFCFVSSLIFLSLGAAPVGAEKPGEISEFGGVFFKCQDQTPAGCKKSRRTWSENIIFGAHGLGRYTYVDKIGRKVEFNWQRSGRVAQVTNKRSFKFGKFSKNGIHEPSNEEHPWNSFELMGGGLIKSDDGVYYLSK